MDVVSRQLYKGLEPAKKWSELHLCVLGYGFLEIELSQASCSPNLLRTRSQREGVGRQDREDGGKQ